MRRATGVLFGAAACALTLLVSSCGTLLGVGEASEDDAGGRDGDGGVTSDGAPGADGAPGPDADAGGRGNPCEGAPLFCDDFENGLGNKWSLPPAGITVVPESGRGQVMRVDVAAGGASTNMILSTQALAPGMRYRVAFSFKVTKADYDGWQSDSANFAIVAFALLSADNRVSAYVGPNTPNGVDLQMTAQTLNGFRASTTYTPLATGWHELVLDIQFNTAGRYTVTLDGVPIDTRTHDFAYGSPTLQLGLQRTNAATPELQVLYDDVRVDALEPL